MDTKVNLQIKGMHCASCETLVKEELSAIGGITDIVVNNKTGKASLNLTNGHVTDSAIIQAIKNAGYEGQVLNPISTPNINSFVLPSEINFDAKISKDENGELHISGKLNLTSRTEQKSFEEVQNEISVGQPN